MYLEFKDKNCLLYKNLDIIAKKWTIFILLEFSKSPQEELRYNELKQILGNITPKILSNRLSLLVSEQFLEKKELIENNQIQTYYKLTKNTRELLPLIKELKQWGESFGDCIAKNVCNRCEYL